MPKRLSPINIFFSLKACLKYLKAIHEDVILTKYTINPEAIGNAAFMQG